MDAFQEKFYHFILDRVQTDKVEDVKELTLPDTDDDRTLIVVEKIKATPKKYPRQAGTPNKKPL